MVCKEKKNFLFAPRLELGTSRVLGERHDQLDHANRVVEYLGVDPSTSSLLRTHASNCANTPVRHLGDSNPCGQRPLTQQASPLTTWAKCRLACPFMGVGQKNCRVEQKKKNIKLHASDQISKNPRRRNKNWTLHVRESNPGRLRDRQKCYQLHQRGL